MKTLENKDKIGISELLCILYACNNILIVTINQIFNVFIGNTSLDTLMCIGVLGLMGVASLKYIFANLHIEDFAFISAYIIAACLSYILFPSTHAYVYRFAVKILINTLLPYILTKGITDTDKFDKYFDYVSIASILAAILLMSLKNMSETLIDDEMNIAYSFIMPAVYMLYRWLENKKEWWRMVLFAAGVIVLFFAGARGPFLCVIGFVMMYLILNNRKTSTTLISATAFGAVLTLYYSGIITRWFESLQKTFLKMGIPTRIIDMFLKSDLTSDSSRSLIYERVWNSIVKSPLYGNGLLGDRVATEGLYKYGSGTYAHNVFLELVCHFGIFIGIGLIIFVAYIFVKGYKCAQTKNEKGMLTVLISVSVTQLLVSFSYLFSLRLFLAIGYAVVLIQREKYKKR